MQQGTRLKEDEAELDLGDRVGDRTRSCSVGLGSAVAGHRRWADKASFDRGARAAASPMTRLRGGGGASWNGDRRSSGWSARCVDDLRQRASEVHAMRGVDLRVEAGNDGRAVRGPSGSGKEQPAGHRVGLEDPTWARLRVDGRWRPHVASDRARLRSRVVRDTCSRTTNLLPGLTAEENVALPLELDGHSREGARVRRHVGAPTSWVGRRTTAFPTNCPVGERQREATPVPWSASVDCCGRRAVRSLGLGQRRGVHAGLLRTACKRVGSGRGGRMTPQWVLGRWWCFLRDVGRRQTHREAGPEALWHRSAAMSTGGLSGGGPSGRRPPPAAPRRDGPSCAGPAAVNGASGASRCWC